jgi:hypothetical protein
LKHAATFNFRKWILKIVFNKHLNTWLALSTEENQKWPKTIKISFCDSTKRHILHDLERYSLSCYRIEIFF